MRAFVISQQYSPLVWVFHSRHLNNKINRIHERALRIAYKDFESSFNTLLERDDSVCTHTQNLQTRMIEIFETKENINPFMKKIFCERTVTYNLRNIDEVLLPRVRTKSYGSDDTIKYRGQRLWLSLPQDIRNAQSINEFKKEIKSWNGA